MTDVRAFTDLASIATHRIWDGVVARAIHGERVTIGLLELAPNCRVPEHSHAHEQVGILVRGSLRFRVGDEIRTLEPGGTWRILANVPHDVETGPDGALVIEAWSPPRDDWREVEREPPRPPDWPG
jgi:quercetin dioxygenase-like cupin family protein